MFSDGLLSFPFDIKLTCLCIPDYSSRGWTPFYEFALYSSKVVQTPCSLKIGLVVTTQVTSYSVQKSYLCVVFVRQ